MACPQASQEINDLIECSICQEEFNDPRTLPCVHSFCLNCIKICSKDKQPGNVMSCPLCRECFKIPVDGIDGLPKNFLIKKIIEVKDAAFAPCSTLRQCETCCQDENGLSRKKKTAVVFCVECRQMLCTACEATHRKLSISCSHECLKLGDGLAFVDMLKKLPDTHCAKHQLKKVELYCYDCKHTICLLCFIDSHKSHRCSAIETAVEEFRSQMTDDITGIDANMSRNRALLDQRMKEELEDVDCKFIKAEKEIKHQAKQMKRFIESERDALLDELTILKQRRVTDVENAFNANDQYTVQMYQWKVCVEEIMEEGTAIDLVRDAAALHDRATELLASGDGIPDSLGTLSVVYKASDRLLSGTGNMLGKIDVNVTKTGLYLVAVLCSEVSSMPEDLCSGGARVSCARGQMSYVS